ncbi:MULTISPECIES: competence type IV pilus minor pilin ComGF [Paraliobacillus]|uniref:competence type IV pilus minor pilin ComGF n=1 Tax=Paraliobacillus TaxID=200903 RepID=UPI000DD44FEA|nr:MULTISPECIES: competence type IV pilus minor pilin ComGF [Paraliobacillus]
MLKIKPKKFAYIIIQTEKGFTLISILFSLALISTTLALIPTVYRLIDQQSYTDELSVRQFFHFLSNEIHENDFNYIDDNTIHLTKQTGEHILISPYQNTIRKQINNTGHEILVRNVKTFILEELSFGIHVTITTITGELYAKTISFY